MGSKKVVLGVDLHDDKDKQKAMKVVSKIPCIDSIAMDMKAMRLTVVGDIDPITVVNRLRKYWATHIFSVGPAKEPEKKKDGDGKPKEGGGGGDPNKTKDDAGKDKTKAPDPIPAYNPYILPYYPHNVTYNPHVTYPQHVNSYYPPPPPPMPASYGYAAHEENPNGCVIC